MPVAFLYYGVFLFSTVDGDARGTFISFSFIFGFILIISFTLLFFSAIAVIETKFFNYKKSRNDDE